MNKMKLLQKAIASPANLHFDDMTKLAVAFGFRRSRISGSHHIYMHPSVDELLNLQNVGGKAKPYQVRQFLRLVEQYNLKIEA